MSDAKKVTVLFTTVFTVIFIASDVNSNRKLRVVVFHTLRNFLNLKLCAGPNGYVVYIALVDIAHRRTYIQNPWTRQEQKNEDFLFNQNAIIHLKSSNTNRILARDSNDDDYYCTKSEAHHQMRLHTSISTSAQLSKNLYKVDFEWLKPTLA